MKTIAIIPAYNEADNITALIENILNLKLDIDILVINDASIDNTSDLARKAGAKVIDLPINMGIGGTVQTGYIYAHRNNYDIAVQIDGDGQHDPGFIPALIEPLVNSQADLVIGSRFLNSQGFQSYFLRRIGIRIIRTLLWLVTGKFYTDPTSGLRAGNRRIISLFAKYYPIDYPEPESLVTVSNNNLKIFEIPVKMQPREGGTSSISGLRTIYYMFKVCLAILINKFKRNKLQGKI